MKRLEPKEELELFKEYIRIPTVSFEGPKNGSYRKCAEWIFLRIKELLPIADVQVVELVEGKPIVTAVIPGSDSELEGLCLNSHYDVVPALRESWSVDPFAAVEIDGKIYGRGTQDMKSVGIQYILALSRIYENTKAKLGSDPAYLFKRNVYLSYVPDEEIGGRDGMAKLIDSGEFDRLMPNVGIALDEGLATPQAGKNTVFYGERTPLWVVVKLKGPTGHGSRFIDGTATEKLIRVANKAFEKRSEQKKLLGYSSAKESITSSSTVENGCAHCQAKKLGDVLTINLTVLQAGVANDGLFAMNVIPEEALAGFDIRVPITMPFDEVRAMLDEWTEENGVSWEIASNRLPFESNSHCVTCIDPESNRYWRALAEACKENGIDLEPEIFPAATDSRYIRKKGLSAFGFSPMSGSQILLHENDEYLEIDTFMKGIGIYETCVIPTLANLE